MSSTATELRGLIADILRASPLLTASEIVAELEVAGFGDSLPAEVTQRPAYVWFLLRGMPDTITVERVEVIPQARCVKRYALVSGA